VADGPVWPLFRGTLALSGFVSSARRSATWWRQTTQAIPEALRSPGDYRTWQGLAHCLVPDARRFNLLPEARAIGIERSTAAGIPWHDGMERLPSNNLLSSQAQCVNALAPHVANPEALGSIFGGVLDIEQLLPFHGTGAAATRFDWDDHVVFEWAGAEDYLGERRASPLSRGANTTSADAAIRYRNSRGSVSIALVEWKYTENYRGRLLSGGPRAQIVRRERYARWWSAHGPITTESRA
jgi:hypothetical protein